MDDLRNEIRAAFEKEQSMYPPAGNLRPNLVRSAVIRPAARQRNYQWLAVAAAVALTALVVLGLMSSRLTNNRGTAAPHKGAPAPRQYSGDYGTPPVGVPLVYVGDPTHPGWYIGFDWTGKPRGTVELAQPLDNSQTLVQSPDGQAFIATGNSGKGGGGQFLDRVGAPTSSVTPGLFGIWADDSTHVCSIVYDPNRYTWSLMLDAPNQAERLVSVIARDRSAGETGIGLVGCSIKNDRVIAIRTVVNYSSELWVVQLSTGRTLMHLPFASGQFADIVASADGNFVAENSSGANGRSGVAPSTRVVRVSDQTTVTTLTPTMSVLAFSADDSYALVTTSPWVAGEPVQLAVLELSNGRTVWQSGTSKELAGYLVEPTGSGFAILFTDDDRVGRPVVSIVMVDGNGKSTAIPGTYQHP